MKVYRKQTVHYCLKGKRVPKGTKGAKAETLYSAKFYGTLRKANGKRRQVPLSEDKATSETLLRRLQVNEDHKRATGVTEYDEVKTQPIAELVGDYEKYLTAKGNTPLHVSMTLGRIRKILSATKTKTIADLDACRISQTLANWRQRKSKPLSINTTTNRGMRWKSSQPNTNPNTLRFCKRLP